jgi:hypothetical protein
MIKKSASALYRGQMRIARRKRIVEDLRRSIPRNSYDRAGEIDRTIINLAS